ncbi:hypothetical protein JX83_20785 [Salmonella enterica]|nr:hypothetical protein [Salmonella enterica]
MPPFIINQWGLLFNNQLNYLSSSYSHISQGISYISDLNSAATLKLRCSRETEQQIFFSPKFDRLCQYFLYSIA